MNSDSPNSPREELEARLTALLLGELSAEESAMLQHAIAQDAELARLHDRLKQAVGLVRETVTSPEQENLAPPDASKLSPERRAALLAAFKVIRPKELRKTKRSKFARRELLAVAAMIAILCLATAIIIPNFVGARSAAQRQHLYVARDESLAEAAASATPLARGEDGRVSVSRKRVDLDGMGRVDNFSDVQPQKTATLTAALVPQRPTSFSSISLPSVPPANVPPTEPKPEIFSVAVVGYATPPPPPPTVPPLTPPPAPDSVASGERAVRQLAAIALPATAGDALSTSLDDKNNGWAEQGVNVARAQLLAGSTTTPDSAAHGGGGGGRGVGGAGLGTEIKFSEYAGVSLAGAAGADGGFRSVRPAPSAKPADRSTSFAFGIAPVPAPAEPATDLDVSGKRPSFGAAQDDGVRFKEMALDQHVAATNAFISRFPTSVGDPAWQDMRQFGGVVAGVAVQTPNVLQGFSTPTLEPEALGVLGDLSDSARLNVNGAVDGTYYRLLTPYPGATGAKDAVDAEEKLAELSKSERLDPAAGINTLHFDAEGKSVVRDLQRESGVKSDEKSQVEQQSADGAAAVNKRFKIALPESERGEAKEELRVATGPVVISEIMANPVTGLPAQKPADVGLAVDEAVRRQVKQSPATPAIKTPVAQAASVELTGVTDGGVQQGHVLLTLEPEILRRQESARIEAKVVDSKKAQVDSVARDLDAAKADDIEQAIARRPYIQKKRELERLQTAHDKLMSRIIEQKVETSIPKNVGVEIIDAAKAEASGKPSLWQRVRGVVGGDVERTTRVSVRKDTTDIVGLGGDQANNTFDPYWVQTESEMIQSKAVLGKVIEQLNLNEAWGKTHAGGDTLQTEETYRLLKKKIDVRSDPKTGLIDILAKSDSPDEAARIANTVAQVYGEARREKFQQLTARGLEALSEELVRQGKEIARVEQELDRHKEEPNPEQTDVDLPKLAASAPIPQPEVATTDNAFSTFSLNVSDVSFKLAAASLEKGQMPDPATVRSEEFINAFDYRDPEPKGSAPIAFTWERARYPFAHDRDLLRFSVKTAASGRQPGRPLNLVLLLDNSGSMERADRVRIRQECLRVLASQLQPQDRVSVVAFARTPRLWVDGLPGSQAGELSQRVGTLAPEGGTNLEDAMNVAYKTALKHFLANGVNRVVLLTDGAANLGDVEPESLKQKVEAHRKQGVALDCFGIGWDGLNDELLEALSRNGDGRYGFVNTPEAATTEFASQLAGALKVAASDVKVQVQWNPRRVTAYRQIGYAKHQLKKEQFRDNTVDAAEIGAAEAGNALYAVQVDPRGEGPIGTVRVRFKVPGTGDYREHEWTVPYDGTAKSLNQSRPAMRLAASASAFSEWLVSSPFAAEVTPDRLLAQMNGVPETWPADPRPKKLEWMIRQAKSLAGK